MVKKNNNRKPQSHKVLKGVYRVLSVGLKGEQKRSRYRVAKVVKGAMGGEKRKSWGRRTAKRAGKGAKGGKRCWTLYRPFCYTYFCYNYCMLKSEKAIIKKWQKETKIVKSRKKHNKHECWRCGRPIFINRYCDSCRQITKEESKAKARLRVQSLPKIPITPELAFLRYKNGALSRNLEFSLTYEEFLSFWQLSCTYCGSSIGTIGLDRVDSNLGYTINNVVPCCSMCNFMKLRYAKDQFLSQCERIYKFQNP